MGVMIKEPNRIPNTNCKVCQSPIYRRPSQVKKQLAVTCSRACRNKLYTMKGREAWQGYTFPKGEKNPAWKGGLTYKRPKGNYKNVKYVRCPQEFLPMARKDGYIMEHRLIMAKHLGRLLERVEVVHHIDHDPANNSVENLMLFATNAEHKRYEHSQKSL